MKVFSTTVQSNSLQSYLESKVLNNIWEMFIYSNIAKASFLMIFASCGMFFLGIGIDWVVLSVIFFHILFVYNLDRLRDLKNQPPTDQKAMEFYYRKKKLIYRFISIATISLIGLSFLLKKEAFLVFALAFLIGFLYGLPLIKIGSQDNAKTFRLKDIPYSKSFIVTSTFVWEFLGLTIANTNEKISLASVLVLVCFYFISIFSAVVAGDLRDIESDQSQNIRTLPVLFGYQKIKFTLMLINLIFVLTCATFHFGHSFETLLPLMSTSLGLSLFLFVINKRTIPQQYSYIDFVFFVPVAVFGLI